MDILIKSFNRAYYLDRCVSSIEKYIDGDIKIKILDDGTPSKYLNLIKQKHPQVTIITSQQYNEKVKSVELNITTGSEINGFIIPTQMWIEQAQKSSEYFIMTEDDVWFFKPLAINPIINNLKIFNIHLLNLSWLGNKTKNYPITDSLTDLIYSSTPKNLFTPPRFIFKAYYYNQFKLFSILYKLGLVNNNTKQKYWQLNSILMGLWNKKYWLEVWKDIDDQVDEHKQLFNAAIFFRKNKKNKNFIGTLKQAVMETTFKSSATNSHHQYNDTFDVNRFNYIMNEAWFKGDLNIWENFPKDFSDSYIISFLNKINDAKAQSKDWLKWSEKFKNQYRNLGIKIDD